MTLLIVDDEYYAIKGIRDSVEWEKLHYDQVLDAESYGQAVEIFQREQVDVLLCDIEMPKGSGLDLVQWVRNNSEDTVCIFLSCHDEFDFAQRAIKLDCMDYVLKPALPDLLSEVLQKAYNLVVDRSKKKTYESYGKNYLETDNLKNYEKKDYVTDTKDYVRKNIQMQYTVEELAGRVNISPDHLTRLFKKKYGKSVIDYVTELKMNVAREMIKSSGMLNNVAEEVGYVDYGYFSKSFKKMFGQSPKEYRESLLETK